jgi:hypothetical protein
MDTCAATSAYRVGSRREEQVFAVGYLEITDDSTPVTAFDEVVRTAVAERADPCAAFKDAPRAERRPPGVPVTAADRFACLPSTGASG